MGDKMVKVIVWGEEGGDRDVYRLDDVGSALHFFKSMLNNAEVGDTVEIAEVTEEQWAEIEAEGEALA